MLANCRSVAICLRLAFSLPICLHLHLCDTFLTCCRSRLQKAGWNCRCRILAWLSATVITYSLRKSACAETSNSNVVRMMILIRHSSRNRNKSVIVDLFQGQLKSTLQCMKCSYVNVSVLAPHTLLFLVNSCASHGARLAFTLCPRL